MPSTKKTRIFTTDEAIARLGQAVHSKAINFYSMYSSVLGGIVTDPAVMVLPLDDHMVHRGHAVFDTATLTHGMLYQLDPHLDRLLRSAELARIPLPFPREDLRQIILDTAAASGKRDGSGSAHDHPDVQRAARPRLLEIRVVDARAWHDGARSHLGVLGRQADRRRAQLAADEGQLPDQLDGGRCRRS